MKQLTCKQLGGPCDAAIQGNSKDEISKNGMAHVQQAHPEMAEQMKNMKPEDAEKWDKEVLTPQYDAAPEM